MYIFNKFVRIYVMWMKFKYSNKFIRKQIPVPWFLTSNSASLTFKKLMKNKLRS